MQIWKVRTGSKHSWLKDVFYSKDMLTGRFFKINFFALGVLLEDLTPIEFTMHRYGTQNYSWKQPKIDIFSKCIQCLVQITLLIMFVNIILSILKTETEKSSENAAKNNYKNCCIKTFFS